MGWFSSYKTNVFTSVSRVVEDNQLPKTIEGALMEAILQGGDVTSSIIEGALNGPAPSFNRMFEYAKKSYPFGLPNSTVSNTSQGKPQVLAAIEQETGQTVTLESMFLGAMDNVFMGWKEITEQYGYDHYGNTLVVLSQQVGFPVYLDTIIAVHQVLADTDGGYYYSNSNQVPTSGFTPERAAQRPGTLIGNANLEEQHLTGDQDGFIVRTIYRNGEGTLVRSEFFVPLVGYDSNDTYFHARYRYGTGSNTVTGYWVYKDNSGTHPAVDEIHNARYTNAGTFFPFIFFRHHSQNRTHSSLHGSEQYKASVKMLDIVNLDYQAIGDAIHENEDADDIEQATMMMGIPINSQDATDLRYLHLFFGRLADQTSAADAGFDGTVRSGRNYEAQNNNAITVQDADFKFVLSYGTITKKLVAGKLGKPGTHTGGMTSFDYKTVVTERDNDGNRTSKAVTVAVPQRYFRRQINASMYEEIKVANPKMVFVIYQSGNSRIYDVSVDSTDDRMLVPLDKNLADQYSLVEQEELYFRSLHFVVNSKVRTKVEWYQTGIFKVFLIVVSVAIFIAFPPAGTPALMAALGIGSSVAAIHLLLAVFFYVVQGLILSYVFKLVVRELGIENAWYVAIAAAVLALASGQFEQFTFMADNLVMAVSGLTAGMNAHVKDQMDDLRKEGEEFGLEAQDKWDALEEVSKLLDMDSLLDPFAFVGLQPLFIPAEGPEAFYSRTIDSGNVGVLVYEQLENYVDNSLTLPDITDTIGDDFYA